MWKSISVEREPAERRACCYHHSCLHTIHYIANTQIHKYTNTQIHKYINAQICWYQHITYQTLTQYTANLLLASSQYTMQAQLNRGMKIKTFLKHHHHEFLNLLGTGSHENILNVLDFVHILCTLYTLNCVLYGVWYVGCSVQCFVLWGLVWFQHLCRGSVCAFVQCGEWLMVVEPGEVAARRRSSRVHSPQEGRGEKIRSGGDSWGGNMVTWIVALSTWAEEGIIQSSLHRKGEDDKEWWR